METDEKRAMHMAIAQSQFLIDKAKNEGLLEEDKEVPKGARKATLDEIKKHLEELKRLEAAEKQNVLKGLQSNLKKSKTLRDKKAKDDFQPAPKDVKREEILDEFLVWEPQSFMEKVYSLVNNTMENNFLILVAIMALVHSSIVSVGFFVTSSPITLSMTLEQKPRYFWGRVTLITNFVIVIGIVIWKFVKIGTMVTSTSNYHTFLKEISFYESLGFSLNYSTDDFSNGKAILEKDPSYKLEFTYNKFYSYGFEIVFTLMLFWQIFFMTRQSQSYQFLTSPENQDDIREIIALKNEDGEGDQDISDNEEDKKDADAINIGSKAHLTREEKEKQEEEQKAKELRLQNLERKLKKSFVDNDWFYRKNQLFFMTALLSQLLQSMSFNNCADVPSLFMLLVLLALYPLRRSMTYFYRFYCFVIIYFIQFMLSLKLINETLIRIDFANQLFMDNRDSKFVKINSIIFGGIYKQLTPEIWAEINEAKFWYYIYILVCLTACQNWKSTKWVEIRYKTKHMQGQGKVTKFLAYLNDRVKQDNDILVEENRKAYQKSIGNKKKNKKDKKSKKKKIQKFDTGTKSQESEFNKYLPAIVLWMARVCMFAIVYMYHVQVNVLHLFWIILSFLLDEQSVFFISIVGMIPILSWEFVLIYGVRIPVVMDTKFFQYYGGYFSWLMDHRQYEQSLMFVTLVTFFMMISCYKIQLDQKKYGQKSLLTFMKKRVTDPRFSNGWKLVFFLLRYLHTMVLLVLFFNGKQNLNNVQNLGYMLFFLIYTAYEEIYRKTGIILVFFISSFILGQYAFSFIYDLYEDNEYLMKRFQWLVLFPQGSSLSDPYDFGSKKVSYAPEDTAKNPDFYFRLKPQLFDWQVLIMMSLLNIVNKMFAEKKEIAKLTLEIQNNVSDKFEKTTYYLGRIKTIVKGQIIYALIIFMILIHKTLETNVINWIFFTLQMINFAFIVRGTKTISEIKQQITIINMIKFFSLTILITDVFFISFIGETPKKEAESIDQKFKRAFPKVYDNLELMGFRSNELALGVNVSQELADKVMQQRFFGYTVFFLITVYLNHHFMEIYYHKKSDLAFTEDDYKRLFQFSLDKRRDSDDEEVSDDDFEEDEHYREGLFMRKRVYHQQDLVDFYERHRFTLPFIVYRKMNLWPIFDNFAMFGHIINNGIIVVLALYVNISAFMAFNIICMCCFYSITSLRINSRANKNSEDSGVQSQCDLRMAQLITKRYKNDSFYEFLKLRNRIWNLQFFVLIASAIVGYPSAIFYNLRWNEKNPLSEETNLFLDKASFWLFIGGFYKDFRDGGKIFYITMVSLILGLIIERQAINWLKNRFGCTHYKLQKFIELDQRRESIRYDWEVQNPKYDIESYKDHYFYNDFEDIIQKIKDNKVDQQQKSSSEKLLDEYGRPFFSEFVPYNTGMRLGKAIKFKVLLDCRAPALNLNDQQKMLIDCGQEYDYESVPVLRKYKIEFLHDVLTQAVDRKYKISFIKGMQLTLEAVMLLILMTSIIIKSNIFSLFYLIFIYRLVTTSKKTQILVRINVYMSFCFCLQYVLFLLNLTQVTSPNKFPRGYDSYPKNHSNADLTPQYAIPWFFHYKNFHDLKVGYLIGVGIDTDQVQNLVYDFLNIYLVSMYIMNYRNPILSKEMKKVFWQFPSPSEIEPWKRLQPLVQKQVLWLFQPKLLYDQDEYFKESSNFKKTSLSEKQVANSKGQYEFAMDYAKHNQVDLNEILANYVDIKYPTIFSEDFLKKKKWEIKDNSIYFRLVKQGSQLVYISFHIITIFIVLLMATMRQSIISLGYILILLPRMKDGSEVLEQRNIHQNQSKDAIEDEIDECNQRLESLQQESKEENEEEIQELQEQIRILRKKLNSIIKSDSGMSFKQQEEQRKKQSQKQWSMIRVIQVYLLFYGMLDFSSQIIYQLPLIQGADLQGLGLRKIWQRASGESNDEVFRYKYFLDGIGEGKQRGLTIHWSNFGLQILNCIIISIIALQAEIFNSAGYLKYVTQQGGSLDLLVGLAPLKAKSITYIFNNLKIRKIISIQRKKEAILATVDKLKEKLARWRAFTRTTMINTAQQGQTYDEALHQKFLEFNAKQQQAEAKADEDIGSEEAEEQSPTKTVKFAQENDEENKEEKGEIQQRGIKISPEQSRAIQQQLAIEFVKSKQSKLRFCVRVYLWLNKTFTEQIMFKNREDVLKDLVNNHATGDVKIPTELEAIMQIEAEEIISHHYDHLEGRTELASLLYRSKGKTGQTLLSMTGFDKKIKLKDMQKTWEFTRPWPMFIHLLETFFYIIISQTQNLIYFSMILSMYQNAGIISLFYPISVFGVALMQETRPTKEYWNFVRSYTTVLLFFKLIMNLSILASFQDSDTFKFYTGLLKIGIYDYQDMLSLTLYMMPEILIISFIMLNEVKLKLLGLYYDTEEDIESVLDGIQRNIEQGDEEKVRLKKIEASNMCMSRYFQTLKEQVKMNEEYVKSVKEEIELEIEERDGQEMEEKYGLQKKEQILQEELDKKMPPIDPKVKQDLILKDFAKQIQKTSREFDVDNTQSKKVSPLDVLVMENVLQKNLEDDDLLYVEGQRATKQKDFITREDFDEFALEAENIDDCFSAGDFEGDFDDKFDVLDRMKAPKLGVFDKYEYFDNIFPSLKIQKPGYDLYGTTTSILAFTAIFVFLQFQNIVVDPAIFSFYQGQTEIFKGEMAIALLTIIAIIILERYASRIDTKAPEQQRLGGVDANPAGSEGSFFKQSDIFKRSSTNRSMTVRIQTMKTSDLDMQGSAAQDFLKQMYDNDNGSSSFDESKTKITSQQKTKFIMHWTILIVGHFLVFWFFPIRGNYQLYDKPQCDEVEGQFYGCKNFHKNWQLRVFYVLICLYLTFSALQLSYGFPIMKKPSSVTQYYTDVANLGGIIYSAIPFIPELRNVLDFTMSKTSLDLFQFMQLWQYHYELYAAKNGNRWYGEKPLGSETDPVEKCLTGTLISTLLLFVLAGPLLLFSEYGGLISPNPVLSAQFDISLQINKTIYTNTTTGNLIMGLNATEALKLQKLVNNGTIDKRTAVHSSIPYNVFENKNAILKQYDNKMYDNAVFSNWTETSPFSAIQIQDATMADFSDETWDITRANEDVLKLDIKKAANWNNHGMTNVSLQLGYSFLRALPDTAKTSYGTFFKYLNYSLEHDCKTGLQLQEFANLDCSDRKWPNGTTKYVEIYFTQAYDPYLILGQESTAKEINQQEKSIANQKHDLRMKYSCDRTWNVQGKSEPTVIDEADEKYHLVDPQTCKLLNPKPLTAETDSKQETKEDNTTSLLWQSLKLTLFSVLVSSSVLATYSPATFYGGVVYLLAGIIRPIFLYGTWKGWVYECTNPDPIIKCVECVYMKRHEEDLVGEEEAYRIIQEIVRCPELFKAITGSSLKGSAAPVYDKLNEKERAKFDQLCKLEQKGFDVEKIKENLLKGKTNEQKLI